MLARSPTRIQRDVIARRYTDVRTVRVYLLGVALAVLCISTLPLRMSASDYKIIPGERIGDVSLSMPIDEVLKILGTPSQVDRVERVGRYNWQQKHIRVFQSLDTGVIFAIRTYWAAQTTKGGGSRPLPNPHRTDKGIGIGATPEEVRRAYGEEGCLMKDDTYPLGMTREFLWFELGIAFFVATDPGSPAEIRGKVREIGVRRKGSASRGPGEGYAKCSPP